MDVFYKRKGEGGREDEYRGWSVIITSILYVAPILYLALSILCVSFVEYSQQIAFIIDSK